MLALAAGGVFSATTAQGAVNILFIGNSLTLEHDIPDLVADLAESVPGVGRPDYQVSATGSLTLADHRTRGGTLNRIRTTSIDWDYVVIQEHSTRPTDVDAPGVDELGKPDQFKADTTWLYDEVKTHHPGAQVILFETWAQRSDSPSYTDGTWSGYADMQAQLRAHYNDAAENHIPSHRADTTLPPAIEVAPVGDMWEVNLTSAGSLPLHADPLLEPLDYKHAQYRRAYLAALTLFATIYDEPALGLPALGLTAAESERLQRVVDGLPVPEPASLAMLLPIAAWALPRPKSR